MENDLIRRGTLEIAVRELADKHHALGQIEFANGVIKTITRIHAAPTIDAMPVAHGRWIPDVTIPGLLHCSECGYIDHRTTNDYCPSCGARMSTNKPRIREK